ncbi:TasA family protein [Rossellomorea sp. KS-H15a]|uniref:TasA family protein n=1 Tax=Rossellomorea sp. KS-H15a TaxID=2963940 RepID=UPI0020C62D57|nr:TasA family protein [Rossellomorea sp. KS-H15a]UTE77463.1 CalY family protein [Rossellomorea sp. KS-H15a]
MTIKKKLGLGVASAALGISLVGGGTWAAFNDTATINNHFAAGTLDLEVGKSSNKPISFDLSNMKPGDNVQRIFKLNNKGSLAIKEVLLDTTATNFVDGTLTSTQAEYLSQFEIDFMQVDSESTNWEPRAKVTQAGQKLTLADLVDGNYVNKVKADYLGAGNKINLAPLTVADNQYRGIPVNPTDSDEVFIQITFKDDPTKTDGKNYDQNKFQGDKIDFFFNLEATQWDGVNVDSHNKNGAVNNDVQGSADGSTMPNPVTEGTPKQSQEVND